MLETILPAVTDCNIKGDMNKFEQMSKIFASPSAFAYHAGKDLLLNGKDIYNEINTAESDYKAGNWEDFGV